MSIDGLKTYQLSMVQAKAYRRMREYITSYLTQYDLTTMEWTLLGYVSENSNDGINISSIAEEFGVQLSYMTNTINRLVDKKLVQRAAHASDQRIKLIQITRSGSLLVNEIEHQLAENLRILLKGLDPQILRDYVKVSQFLADV